MGANLDGQLHYDFPNFGDIDDSNLFIDAENAFIVFRPSKAENEWRVIYQESHGLDANEIVARSKTTLAELLPGKPNEEDLKIARVRPYQIHQRLVEKMRDGRIVLASDAAHLCCP